MRHCLALDLNPDPALIAEYENYHRAVWPEIKASILDSGITHMEIWRLENRLFMIMETNATFSFEKKAAADTANPTVEKWEQLMWKYQQAIPRLEGAGPKDNHEPIASNQSGGRPGEKWRLMDKIFELK